MVTSVFLKENKKIDNSARNNLCPKNHPAKKNQTQNKHHHNNNKHTQTNQTNKTLPTHCILKEFTFDAVSGTPIKGA